MAQPRMPGVRAPTGGVADYRSVQPEDIGATVDRAQRMQQALQGSGLLAETPQLEAPDVPDPAIRDQAHQRETLTGLVKGMFSTVPMTTYGAKIGQKPGGMINGTGWQAAEAEAADPWEQEKLRVENANKLHAYVNQYAMLSSEVKNRNAQKAFDLAREDAIMRGSMGMFKTQTDLQRAAIENQNKRLDAYMKHTQFNEDATNRRLDQADERLKIAEAKEDRASHPGSTDAEKYAASYLSKQAGQKVIDIVTKQPEVLQSFRGTQLQWDPESRTLHLKGNSSRINGSKAAQELYQNIRILHHYLLQVDARQGTRFGASLLTDIFPKMGDNPGIAAQGIQQLMQTPVFMMQALDEKFPNYDWMKGVKEFDATHPISGGTTIGGGDELDDWMKQKGIH